MPLHMKLKEALLEINGSIVEAADYGAGNYVVTVAHDADGMAYKNYRNRLEASGYIRYVDNTAAVSDSEKKTEVGDYVKCSTYIKEDIAFTLTHMLSTKTTYLSGMHNASFSKHLFYSGSYISDNIEGAQTTLYNLPVRPFGNCMVFQLKNHHFIICDGGMPHEMEYLLENLESLVPEGTKPIVDAWIISHLHRDHSGVFMQLADGSVDASRIVVEGLYYSEPNASVLDLDAGTWEDLEAVKTAADILMTSTGTNPEVYRVQTGQRYYFNDITMDIVFSQEQLPRDNYFSVDFFRGGKRANFNDSSTWYLFTIEGQRVLFTGDADKASMDSVMSIYSREYLKLEMMDTCHHGYNPYYPFVDYVTPDTVMVTAKILETPTVFPQYADWLAPNALLVRKAKETVERREGDKSGIVIFTFPYQPGSYRGVARVY